METINKTFKKMKDGVKMTMSIGKQQSMNEGTIPT